MTTSERITKKNCGAKLAELRAKLGGMSRTDLATVLGVARTTIMRIEEGQTEPSDDFLNRLKAVQIIGAARFRSLSEEGKANLVSALAELGEDAEVLESAAPGNVPKDPNTSGVLTGLGALGASVLGIAALGIVPLLAGYGVAKALKSVLKANNLGVAEKNGSWQVHHLAHPGPKRKRSSR
jgi:transcriptional regulator with XRE-family HTH domain